MSTQTYRLQSHPMIHTPGVIAWAINGYAFEDDRASLRSFITGAFPTVPEEALEQLLTKTVPYKIEGDVVVFSVDARPN